MKTKILLLLFALMVNTNLFAQNERNGHDQSFYFKLDLESGNIFSCAALSGVSAGLNAVTKRNFSINAFTFNMLKAKENTDVENYEWNKVTAEDLFKDIQTGIRIGTRTDRDNFVHFGFYGSVHYKINQFKLEDFATKEFEKHNIHRLLLGLSALMHFGGFGHDFNAFLEAGARYAVATKYGNPYGADKSKLNNGVITHWAFHFSPNGSTMGFQDIGLFVDINHYNLLKDNAFVQNPINEIKMWTLGISCAITPGQAKNR
jgi:hypothetical protein